MKDVEARSAALLRSLRRLARHVALYPEGHPLTEDALTAAQAATADFVAGDMETVLVVRSETFFRNRVAVPHTSLEFRGMLKELQERSIESVTFTRPVSGADLLDLAAFVSGTSDDLPADGTIRLNEPLDFDTEVEVTPASQLRASYGAALDAMRGAAGSLVVRGSFELGSVADAVAGLFERAVAHPGAALLLSTVKSHDEYTYFHSVNVCILSLAVGQMVGVERDVLIPAAVGAVLHDIGKVAVSPDTLNYPGRLSEEQWREITLHPQEGALAILAAGGDGAEIAATVAFEHHVRFDGAGYPATTRDGRPHAYSRLVQVADTYDAITSRRPYRRAESPHRALQVLLDGAGTAWDPEMVHVFIRMMGIYPPGSVVELDTGETAVVVARADEHGAPLPAMIVKDAAGERIAEYEPVRLPLSRVVRQLLPQDAGVDPAALLEVVADQVVT